MGFYTAIGTIIALVVGAGMLGLPFVSVQAGFWNSVFQLVFRIRFGRASAKQKGAGSPFA